MKLKKIAVTTENVVRHAPCSVLTVQPAVVELSVEEARKEGERTPENAELSRNARLR